MGVAIEPIEEGACHMTKPAKRTDFASVLKASQELAIPAIPDQAARSQRPGVKQQTLYLPLPVYKQLRSVGYTEEVRMHALVMEGLDLLFAKRGLPSIENLTRKS